MTVKRSFSLPDEVSEQLDAQAPGNASAYVADAVREKAARDRAWARYVELYGEPDGAVRDAMSFWRQRLVDPAAPAQRAS